MRNILFLFISILSYSAVFSQQVTYTQPESQDSRSLDFQIVGKIGDNFLIYKNIRNNYAICSYDNSMRLIDRVPLTIIPSNTLNVDFVAYPDFAYMIYQYQKRNILYCMAIKLNADGKMLTDPVELDTTHLNFLANNKIYSMVNSEDKSKIMIYKIQRKNGTMNFTTILFNDSLQLLHQSKIGSDFDDRKDLFSDFFVDNEGNFVFTKGNRSNARDFITDLFLIQKRMAADTFDFKSFDLGSNFLDAINLKVDNQNAHYVLTSLYYLKKRGNVEGIYSGVVDINSGNIVSQHFESIADSIRSMAKVNGSDKTALNDFFIRNIYLKKDGGFILTAEDFYSQSRTGPWNRYDYLYGNPLFSPYNYYNMYGGGLYGGYPSILNGGDRYYYNNILVLNMDKTGVPDWASVVNKTQFDDQTDNFLSYAVALTGGELHFLYNTPERRTLLLVDQSVSGSGKVTLNPPFKNLDRGYEFMPRYGKQVSASQIIIPCTYRNYICFAKIEFPY